ncbi:MAG: hypothetical protein A2293_15260 [Elusimicrobia bacterium RIFOXYB2_FULL_49_7]|nr:MAG: hypothetical protein A2293_15260 [Elusimicrobia bacterium RIFOXYB2_FULL_49_7]
MRILLINFEMNEDSGVLAWQAHVAYSLAQKSEFVLVLTEKPGRYEKLSNMEVEVVPKRPYGIPRKLGSRWLFALNVALLCRRHRIDACFIHMNYTWSYVLYPVFKLLGIPVLTWYAHGRVSNALRATLFCSSRVVTSTPEGFRIRSPKVRVIGQGINTSLFKPSVEEKAGKHDLIYVGRVSRRKRIELLISVMQLLTADPHTSRIKLKIIGPLLTGDDIIYERELRSQITRFALQDKIEFYGSVPSDKIPLFYASVFLHLNVSKTGSMDKTVLESLACGCPVLTSNEAFFDFFKQYPDFIITNDQPAAIAEQVIAHYNRKGTYPAGALRKFVEGKNDLYSYTDKILTNLSEIMAP